MEATQDKNSPPFYFAIHQDVEISYGYVTRGRWHLEHLQHSRPNVPWKNGLVAVPSRTIKLCFLVSMIHVGGLHLALVASAQKLQTVPDYLELLCAGYLNAREHSHTGKMKQLFNSFEVRATMAKIELTVRSACAGTKMGRFIIPS